MSSSHDARLPGSRCCVGCNGLTFRQRADGLCPRCAFDAESLIERIEVDGLHHDLQLITEFEAYYRQRERQREQLRSLAGPVFPRTDDASQDGAGRVSTPFRSDPFWASLREAS